MPTIDSYNNHISSGDIGDGHDLARLYGGTTRRSFRNFVERKFRSGFNRELNTYVTLHLLNFSSVRMSWISAN